MDQNLLDRMGVCEMIAVIPCAGEGGRFKAAGYNTPKPLLPMPDGRTLIEHVASSLPMCKQLITVSKAEMAWDLSFAGQAFPMSWLPVHVKRKTRGPLDTLMEARSLLRVDDELLINYCDCFLPDDQCSEFVNEMRSRQRHAGVVCFPSSDVRFQREPSGKFAMSGIFWFKSGRQFVQTAMRYRRNAEVSPAHVAFAIRWMGFNMCAAFITDNIVDLGVPETYLAYLAMHKEKQNE